MRFENVDVPIEIEIATANSHACHFLPITAHRQPAKQSLLAKCAVMIVHEKQAGRGIASNKNVGPAVLINVHRNRREAIRSLDGVDPGDLRNIGESTVAIVAK